MHRLVQRQLKRALGLDPERLDLVLARLREAGGLMAGQDEELAHVLAGLPEFLQRVSDSYTQHDRDQALLRRSLELSSQELSAANERLRAEAESSGIAVHSLQTTLNLLLGGKDRQNDQAPSLVALADQLAASSVQRLKLEENLTQFKRALDEHAIVSMTDTAGNITYVNRHFCEISGFSEAELIGRNHRLLKSGVHSGEFYESFWRTISSGHTWHGEICNRAKDGRLYWVIATVAPMLDMHGLPYQYVAIRADITRIKEAEQALVEAKQAAETANRMKSEFLANMSHEIRTPLNGVLGMLELSMAGALDFQQREYLRLAQESAGSLFSVINDILDFSKIEAGRLDIHPEIFDLRALLEDLAQLHEMRVQAKGVRFLLDIAATLPKRVRGDPNRIRQVLANLLTNATKFTERGVVALRAHVEGAGIRFSVFDTGIGIEPEFQAAIFDPFTQADGSITRKFGGTGLGLSISHRLVQLMGGSLEVTSEPDKGSEFKFTLPLGFESDAVPDSASAQAAPPDSTRLCVLLVEDNPVNQLVARAMLVKAGHQVVLAQNGLDALTALENNDVDVVLMDMQMPGMDGLEATRRIRQREHDRNLPRLPIVALTANAYTSNREQCLEAGMDEFIPKPFRSFEMLAAIQRVLRS